MTEEEAKNMWCPFVRFEIGPNTKEWQGRAFTNRGDELDPWKTTTCLGSICMAWEWTDSHDTDGCCGLARGRP